MNLLDASALLAFLKKEKGWENIEKLLSSSQKNGTSVFIHALNFVELIYKCEQIFGPKKTHQIIADLQSPFLGIINYLDTDLTLFVAHLKANYHLSLAEAVGLAHTKIMNATFWTADNALEDIAKKEKISFQSIR